MAAVLCLYLPLASRVPCSNAQESASPATAAADRFPLTTSADLQWSLESITAEELWEHVQTLASQEYEGRQAGSTGGRKASEYIAEQFKSLERAPHQDCGVSCHTTTTSPSWILTFGPRCSTSRIITHFFNRISPSCFRGPACIRSCTAHLTNQHRAIDDTQAFHTVLNAIDSRCELRVERNGKIISLNLAAPEDVPDVGSTTCCTTGWVLANFGYSCQAASHVE